MFGSKKNTDETKPQVSNSGGGAMSTNSIAKGSEIEGKIVSEGDIRIDGVLRGSLICKAKVVIGPTGSIDGDVTCVTALISGKLNGTLQVKELLDLRATANVTGDVQTEKLVIEAGALFNVTCKMGSQAILDKGGKKDA